MPRAIISRPHPSGTEVVAFFLDDANARESVGMYGAEATVRTVDEAEFVKLSSLKRNGRVILEMTKKGKKT